MDTSEGYIRILNYDGCIWYRQEMF